MACVWTGQWPTNKHHVDCRNHPVSETRIVILTFFWKVWKVFVQLNYFHVCCSDGILFCSNRYRSRPPSRSFSNTLLTYFTHTITSRTLFKVVNTNTVVHFGYFCENMFCVFRLDWLTRSYLRILLVFWKYIHPVQACSNGDNYVTLSDFLLWWFEIGPIAFFFFWLQKCFLLNYTKLKLVWVFII